MTTHSQNEVIFGISGSISAYKSLDVIRLLRKSQFNITPILSESADRFVTPWSVECLAESSIVNDEVRKGNISHIDICKTAQAFIICPASANIISKLAHGTASDILTSSFLSYTGPKVIFPAMHTEMWENPITKDNIQRLKDNGIVVIEPTTGDLASGDIGKGRLPDVNLIADLIQMSVLSPIKIKGKQIVITCGGTSEPIDPVRSITNHASGRSGHVIANLAAYLGANVTLIRTNHHPVLDSIITHDVSTTEDLEKALLPLRDDCNMLIMNAAVSDFTINSSQKKLNRTDFKTLKLTPTNDILKKFNQSKPSHCLSIGFCLHDCDDLVEIAKKKRIEKCCDVIIANEPTAFGEAQRSVVVIDDSKATSYTNISLYDLAHILLKIS